MVDVLFYLAFVTLSAVPAVVASLLAVGVRKNHALLVRAERAQMASWPDEIHDAGSGGAP